MARPEGGLAGSEAASGAFSVIFLRVEIGPSWFVSSMLTKDALPLPSAWAKFGFYRRAQGAPATVARPEPFDGGLCSGRGPFESGRRAWRTAIVGRWRRDLASVFAVPRVFEGFDIEDDGGVGAAGAYESRGRGRERGANAVKRPCVVGGHRLRWRRCQRFMTNGRGEP